MAHKLRISGRAWPHVSVNPGRSMTALEEILFSPGNGALATGIGLTPALLLLDPMFDALRNEPRFQQLAAAKP